MALKLKDAPVGGRSSNELNFLGEGTYVEGTVETKGSLRIDGRVKGAIKTADTLTVGSNGVVSGEVHARVAVVGGRVEGNIQVDDKLVLEANSTLVGNLKAKKLIIDEGAVFQGKSDMGVSGEASRTPGSLYQGKTEDKGETNQPEKPKQ